MFSRVLEVLGFRSMSASAASASDSSEQKSTTEHCCGCVPKRGEESRELVRNFTVDLAVAPELRWKQVMSELKEESAAVFAAVLEFLEFEESEDGTYIGEVAEGVLHNIKQLKGGSDEFEFEMRGIADSLSLDLSQVVLVHLMYECLCQCTAIAASGGWLARTMDWLDLDVLRAAVIDVTVIDSRLKLSSAQKSKAKSGSDKKEEDSGNYYDRSCVLYKMTTFAGYIGALTALRFANDRRVERHTEIEAMATHSTDSSTLAESFKTSDHFTSDSKKARDSAFAFAVNFRAQSEDSVRPKPNWPIGILGRHICDTAVGYEAAVELWKTQPLMAPAFVVIVGSHSAVQLTRDESQQFDPLSLTWEWPRESSCGLPLESETTTVRMDDALLVESKVEDFGNCAIEPYLIQTNIEHYKVESVEADESGELDVLDSVCRLKTARSLLSALSYPPTESDLWNVLMTPPIFDESWTIFSTVVNVRKETYNCFKHVLKAEHCSLDEKDLSDSN